MRLCLNNWEFIDIGKKTFPKIIDGEGNVLIEDIEELEKIDHHLTKESKKKDELINSYLGGIHSFINSINDEIISDIYEIPKQILDECIKIMKELSRFQSIIRTIHSKSKKKTLFKKFEKSCINVKAHCSSVILELLNKWSSILNKESLSFDIKQKNMGILSESEVSTITFQPIKPYLNKLDVWYNLNVVSLIPFRLNINLIRSWRDSLDQFDEPEILADLIERAVLSTGSSQFYIINLVESQSLQDHSSLKIQGILREFIYILANNAIIFSNIKNFSNIVKTKEGKKIKKSIYSFIDNKIKQLVVDMSQPKNPEGLNIPYHQLKEISLNQLHSIMLDIIEEDKQNIINKNEGDLLKSSRILADIKEKYVSFIGNIEDWLNDSILPFIPVNYNLLHKYKIMLSSINEDIIRKVNEFENYAQSIEIQMENSKIKDILDEKIEILDAIYKDYQSQSFEIIDVKFPQIEEIQTIITNFNIKFKNLKEQVQEVFKTYKGSDINLYSMHQYWDEKYQTILAKTNFMFTKVFKNILSQFTEIIEKEEDIHVVEEFDSDKTEKVKGSSQSDLDDLIFAKDLTESDIKSHLEKIDNRLLKLDELQEKYKDERKKYKLLLKKRIKEKGIESKMCSICHRDVDVTDDNYVLCDFCNALFHYTCVAQWLVKYNSCPTCSNTFTQPYSNLYDPKWT